MGVDSASVVTAVIAAFTMLTVVLTWALINENRRLRKEGTEPKRAAYLNLTLTETAQLTSF